MDVDLLVIGPRRYQHAREDEIVNSHKQMAKRPPGLSGRRAPEDLLGN
jgi:hypothetical protein